MPKLKDYKKSYVIIDAKKFAYGAFPFNPEGLEKAKQWLKKQQKSHPFNDLTIIEK